MATDTAHRHVESLLRRGAEEWGGAHHGAHGARASVTDVTGGLAQINLQGPSSRALLARLTTADVSDGAFPFRAARTIAIGCAPVLATRITYVGELGYELFVPTEAATLTLTLTLILTLTLTLTLTLALTLTLTRRRCTSTTASLPRARRRG